MNGEDRNQRARSEAAEDAKASKEQAPRVERLGNTGQVEQPAEEISVWEWLVAAVGLVLVLGSVGFMLYQAFDREQAPPNVTVHVDSVLALDSAYLLQFRAINRGEEAAAGVTIEGELKSDTGAVETGQVTVDYIPSQSERRGGLFFREDPRRFRVEVRATGYQRP